MTYPYKLAQLKDCGGDLSKSWYIEYYVFSEETNDLVRKRNRIPPSYTTAASRRKYASVEIKETNEVLVSGFYIKKNQDPSPDTKQPVEPLYLIKGLRTVVSTESNFLRKKSVGTYNTAINKIAKYLDKDIEIASFTIQNAYLLRDHFITIGNNTKTVNKTLDHLARIYEKLAKRHDIPKNPFRLGKLPTTQNSSANIAFTDEDRATLEKYMKTNNYPLFVFTRCMYYAFIRPRELRFLKVKNVTKEHFVIPGEIAKNRRTESVAIIPPLAGILTLENTNPSHYLFGAGLVPARGQCSENTPLNWHTAALEACGLKGKGYTLYSWKHTGAVNAYLSGVGIKQLQLLLRHSTVQMTDIYLKSLGLRTDPNIENYNW